jgi:hypothetical protein
LKTLNIMLTNYKIHELLRYFVDGTELSKEDINILLKYFLIERINDDKYLGYILTITGKTMLKQINKGA